MLPGDDVQISEEIEIFERQEGTVYKLSKQHEFRRSLVDTRQIT